MPVGRLVEAPVEVLVPEISEIDTKLPVARLASEVEAAVPLAAVVEITGVIGSVGRLMDSSLVPAADMRLLQKDGSYVVVDSGASVFSWAFLLRKERSCNSDPSTTSSPSQHCNCVFLSASAPPNRHRWNSLELEPSARRR